MAQVTVTNNHTSTLELPAPLNGSLVSHDSKIFANISMHALESSQDLQEARARGLLTLVIAEDPGVADDMEEASVATATGGTAALVAAHSALATTVHGVGGSTVESVAGANAKVGAHAGLATAVHGVGGSTVASVADIATHAALGAGAVHGIPADPAPDPSGTYTIAGGGAGDLASITIDAHGRITGVTTV
jgi:hypothetical protein